MQLLHALDAMPPHGVDRDFKRESDLAVLIFLNRSHVNRIGKSDAKWPHVELRFH